MYFYLHLFSGDLLSGIVRVSLYLHSAIFEWKNFFPANAPADVFPKFVCFHSSRCASPIVCINLVIYGTHFRFINLWFSNLLAFRQKLWCITRISQIADLSMYFVCSVDTKQEKTHFFLLYSWKVIMHSLVCSRSGLCVNWERISKNMTIKSSCKT